MILDLCYYGDPILRKKCLPVEEITSEIRTFVSDMIETVRSHHAIGLAANQVGKLLQIFLICEEKILPNGECAYEEAEVYINPKLSSPSNEKAIALEGCLSFPKLHLDIERPKEITVEALNLEGKLFTKRFSNYPARQIMHENDHILGTLFIDRLSAKEKKKWEPMIQKIKKKYKK